MAKILALDTSTKQFSLAVGDGDKVIARRNVVLNKVLSSSIVPSIDRILSRAKVPLKALDGFAVGLGPGSFTSLRVGLATVKGLAFATRKPVVGISSLDVLAMGGISAGVPQICACMDAKRNLVYACIYGVKDGELKRKSKYLLVPPVELAGRITQDVFFIGDGVGLYKDVISALSQQGKGSPKRRVSSFFAPERLRFPQAKHLLTLAREKFEKKYYDDIDRLVPLYLYPPDCQVQR